MKLKFGTGKLFGMRSPTITLRIHKNKPGFSYFTFQVPVMLDWKWDWKTMWHYNYSKKIFSSETKEINLTFCQNWH